MNKILLSIGLPVLLGCGWASRAEAGHGQCAPHTWVSGYGRCGCPAYSERIVVGYDPCGRPVFHVRAIPLRHRCHARVVRPDPCWGGPAHAHHGPGVPPNHRAWSVPPPPPHMPPPHMPPPRVPLPPPAGGLRFGCR
jgi:hypothetical protein